MSGESYGVSLVPCGSSGSSRAGHGAETLKGIYLPNFASAVVDQNVRIAKEGRTPINLKSVMIGNGAYSQLGMYQSGYDYVRSLPFFSSWRPLASCPSQVRCDRQLTSSPVLHPAAGPRHDPLPHRRVCSAGAEPSPLPQTPAAPLYRHVRRRVVHHGPSVLRYPGYRPHPPHRAKQVQREQDLHRGEHREVRVRRGVVSCHGTELQHGG